MSMYTTAKTWDEMMKVVRSLEPPTCLSVNYDPDNDEYKIWCGNQPYYFYDNEIEKLEKETKRLKKENKMYSKWVNKLQCEKDTLNYKIERVKEFTNSKTRTVFFKKDQDIIEGILKD